MGCFWTGFHGDASRFCVRLACERENWTMIPTTFEINVAILMGVVSVAMVVWFQRHLAAASAKRPPPPRWAGNSLLTKESTNSGCYSQFSPFPSIPR